MTEPIKTIQREASDTSKGYTLQKLRTISLILEELARDEVIDFIAAVEYNGDVFLEKPSLSYIEENKFYESQNFTFVSPAIRNTIVYFLDHWLNNKKDDKIKFGIYATNNCVKEVNRGFIETEAIALPENKIIDSLIDADYTDSNTLTAAKAIVIHEYKSQYSGNKSFPLASSHYQSILNLGDSDWKLFFSKITWHFNGSNLEELEAKIIDQITTTKFITSDHLAQKAPYIRAELFYQLEIRQTKKLASERFLTQENAELIFRRALSNDINENSYKYLNIDYGEIRTKTTRFIKEFIDSKYFALSGVKKSPTLLQRQVAFFDASIRLTEQQAHGYLRSKPDTLKGSFAKMVEFDKPTFLFGELGSGKSSIVASYVLKLTEEQREMVTVFIPASLLQNQRLTSIADVKSAINWFVNSELQLEDPVFNLDVLFKTKKETTIIIDGLDELNLKTARVLVGHLKSLKINNDNLRMIATGRPVELEGIVPAGWNTLFTIPLNEGEVQSILEHEALNRNFSLEGALGDSRDRLAFLKSRSELFAIATTPLIICAIWESLTQSLSDKTLGDILYEALQRKLKWGDLDKKTQEDSSFEENYPSIYNKEVLLSKIAWHIVRSDSKSITEPELNALLTTSIPKSNSEPKIVTEAISFFKNAFLLETSDKRLGFISAPLLECAAGLAIVEILKSKSQDININEHWRSLAFALAISRQRGISADIEGSVEMLMQEHMKGAKSYVLQFAIILAEFKNQKLCTGYFELLNGLEFRPFRFEGGGDALSASSYATCIQVAGESGFQWFWENYLDLRNPILHYQGNLIADILAHYFIKNDYNLNAAKTEKLGSLIAPNIAFPNSFCYEVLPVLATIISEPLTSEQHLQLLAGLLSHDVLAKKSQDILLEASGHSKENVLKALEAVCHIRETGHLAAAKLWLKLNDKGLMDLKILSILLGECNSENFEELSEMLSENIGKQNLLAFMKYCVLSKNGLASNASFLLFFSDFRDFGIIGRSLIDAIDWLDKRNDTVVEEIKNFVAEQSPDRLEEIFKNIPKKNYLGIPPAFWRIFLPSLERADRYYLKEFSSAVTELSLLILTRYPEIRIAFASLFKEKVKYKELLIDQMYGLDIKPRYMSAAILLTIDPEVELEALEIVIGGMSRSSDMDEWESFCLGLNYNKRVLEFISERSEQYIGIPKIYSLILLSRYNFALSESQSLALYEGLLGAGFFLDREGSGMTAKYHVILSDPKSIEPLIRFLNDENFERAHRAADILFNYHLASVDPKLTCRIFLLTSERNLRRFYEMTQSKTEEELSTLLSNIDQESERMSLAYGNLPLLTVFYKMLQGDQDFSVLLERIVQQNGSSSAREIDDLYLWTINIHRLYPRLKDTIRAAIAKMLSIPVILEKDHALFTWLKLFENEFDPGEDTSSDVLHNLPSLHNLEEEVFIALHVRGVYKRRLAEVRLSKPQYYSVFAKHRPDHLKEINRAEIESYLFDLESIPGGLNAIMERTLLFGNLSNDELAEIEKKGNLASYFVSVVKFCRGETVDVERFADSKEIGGFSLKDREERDFHNEILMQIYGSLISEDDYLQKFIDGQLATLNNPNKEDFVSAFNQLIVLNHKFNDTIVISLFEELYQNPYQFRPGFALSLSNYLLEHISDHNKQLFIDAFNKYLLAFRNLYHGEGKGAEFNLILWFFSLFLLHLEEKVTINSRTGFLLGARYLFLEKNSLERNLITKPDYFFAAGALLKYSLPILEKVDPMLIKEVVDYGKTTNIPEVRATCYVLGALVNGWPGR